MAEVEQQVDDLIKMHVFIRTDLGMTKGKICAQAAHAVLGLHNKIDSESEIYAIWASLDYP